MRLLRPKPWGEAARSHPSPPRPRRGQSQPPPPSSPTLLPHGRREARKWVWCAVSWRTYP